MTAEQVHEELTKKAHQQYKDIAVVCINFPEHDLFSHRREHQNVSECNLFKSIYSELEKSLITFATLFVSYFANRPSGRWTAMGKVS